MRIIAVWLGLSFFTHANAQSVPSIAQFDITLEANQTLPLGDEISFQISTSNALAISEKLHNWPAIKTQIIDSNKLLIEMSERPTFSGKVSPKYLLDSFVIDVSEKSTTEFTSGFINSNYLPLELPKLAAYVAEYINQPTYINGFHIASVVATQRSGDCTEYAVLLTALARSVGLSARVIIGTVIIEEKEQISAFGHAWVEVWHNEKWNILDAALYQSRALKHFYLPASELENEGPGFTMSLAKATTLLPNKIRGLRNAN